MKRPILRLRYSGLILTLAFAHVQATEVHPIVQAAARADAGQVHELLRQGAPVNAARGDGMTALHLAAETGDVKTAELLLRAGANVEAGTRIGRYTPLHVASLNGHAPLVRLLLAAGADVHAATTNSGTLAVHLAAASGSPETLTALLEAGADANAVEGAWEQTPLIFAAAANRVENIRVLVAWGADPSVAEKAIDAAERERADQLAEKQLQASLAAFKEQEGGGPDWRPRPSQVQAAIESARTIQRKWPNVPGAGCQDAESSAGADCAGQPDDETAEPMSYGQLVGHWGGLTPLLHAVREGHEEAVLALLEAGADINQPSAGDRTTPLLMAAVNGQFDLALLLLERGADPNLAADAGTTPLFAVLEREWASWANYAHPVEHIRQKATHIDVLKALLEAGADPNMRLNRHLWYAEYTISVLGNQAGLHYSGATPFWRAALALDVAAMRLLKEYGADPHVPTRKRPERRRRGASQAQQEGEGDPTGLPPVPVGGPNVFPIHAASGAGYGQSFAASAHRHVPGGWLAAVRFLVEECGADVNLRDANGYTPLHHAAARGDNEMIRYLVSKGADVTAVSRSGQTTADMANGPIQRVPPFPETIELLVSLGAVNNNKCVSC